MGNISAARAPAYREKGNKCNVFSTECASRTWQADCLSRVMAGVTMSRHPHPSWDRGCPPGKAERCRRLQALSEAREALVQGPIASAVARTDRCAHGFSCLSGSLECLHEISDCISGCVHFIEHDPCGTCTYKVRFGSGCLCDCPVRKEIYNRFGI